MERKYPFVFLCAFKMDFILFPYGAFIKECLSLNFQWGNLSSKKYGNASSLRCTPVCKMFTIVVY